jgi:hypothetical protein
MPDIYAQHKAAFPNVSAYVIARNGARVATIAFKYPRDGAGRLYAYVHWIGVPMVRGFAGGGGYDKHSAAVADVVRKGRLAEKVKARAKECRIAETDGRPWHDFVDEFVTACLDDNGFHWGRRLEKTGFTVWQAV